MPVKATDWKADRGNLSILYLGIFDLRMMLSLAEGPSLSNSFGSLLSFDMFMALLTSDRAAVVHKVALLRRMGNFSAFCASPFKIWKEAWGEIRKQAGGRRPKLCGRLTIAKAF